MRTSRYAKVRDLEKNVSTGLTLKESGQSDTAVMDSYGVHQVEDGVVFLAFYPHARTVQIAGDFNDWQPAKNPLHKVGNGDWKSKLRLGKGMYRYRYVVDGCWQQDPYNQSTEPNPYGEMNSVIKVE